MSSGSHHILTRKDFKTAIENLSHQLPHVILQSSSGSMEDVIQVPRSFDDIADVAKRVLKYYHLSYEMPPKRIILLGGVSHIEASKKLHIEGVELIHLGLEHAEQIPSLTPDILSCYPSMMRELLYRKIDLSTVKMFKLGGEVVFPEDIANIHAAYASVPVLEQLGSTEMPAYAFRYHQQGVFTPYFTMENKRFDVLPSNMNGWVDLYLKDQFEGLLVPMEGYYDTQDQLFMKEGRPCDVRRRGDPSFQYRSLLRALYREGCSNIQIDPTNMSIYYQAHRAFPESYLYDGITYRMIPQESLTRLSPSNKLPVCIKAPVLEEA